MNTAKHNILLVELFIFMSSIRNLLKIVQIDFELFVFFVVSVE